MKSVSWSQHRHCILPLTATVFLNLLGQYSDQIIEKLSTPGVLLPTEKICLARELDIPSFLREGCVALVRSIIPPTLEEIRTIGWETYGQIAYAREQLIGHDLGTMEVETKELKCVYCEGSDVTVHCQTTIHKHRPVGNRVGLGRGRGSGKAGNPRDPGMVMASSGWYAKGKETFKGSESLSERARERLDERIWNSLNIE